MGIKRSLIGLVTMAVAATALVIGLSAVKPDTYFDMHRSTEVGRLIVTANSATTPYASPQTYFDM
jgi:hypothetical protein